MIRPSSAAILAVPTAAVAAAGVVLARDTHGSIAGRDWLPYAILVALVVATIAAAGAALRPARLVAIGLGGLAGLAVWDALSIAWSPVPPLARDEALLVCLYALVFAVPVLTLVGGPDRLVALGLVVVALTANVLLTAVRVVTAENPLAHFSDGRLADPIGYANANAGLFALAFWPALLLAVRRAAPLAWRALALAAATTLLAGVLSAQSKGAIVGLCTSALLLLALCPARLRLVPPAAIVAVLGVLGFPALTAPYRNPTAAEARGVGWAILWLGGAAAGAGLAYAFVDRRVELSEARHRLVARAAAAAAAAAVVALVAGFFVSVGDPGRYLDRKWAEFKSYKIATVSTSHLGSLGSNRYDFWRVALGRWTSHPLFGDGARSFGVEYLQRRRSVEAPKRAHSLPLDTLAETGLVGGALLLVALGAPLLFLARRLGRVPSAAAFATGVYGVVHCAVDWTWTFPTFGIPLFLLLGIGCADGGRRLRRPLRLAAVVAPLVVAVVFFLPSWIGARLVTPWLLKTQFLLVTPEERPAALADARWSHRLDPLSPDPLVVQSRLAPTLADSVRIMERAVAMEPEAVALRIELAQRQLSVGDKPAARKTLAVAERLLPGDARIARLRREAAG